MPGPTMSMSMILVAWIKMVLRNKAVIFGFIIVLIFLVLLNENRDIIRNNSPSTVTPKPYIHVLQFCQQENKTLSIHQPAPTEHCPQQFHSRKCGYEVSFIATEKVVHEPTGRVVRYIYVGHKGSVKLNGKIVYKWSTKASLTLVHVNMNCEIVSKRQFYSKGPNQTLENVTSQIQNYFDDITDKDLILGALYGDKKYLNLLLKFGLRKDRFKNFIPDRGIVAFQLRKHRSGHSNVICVDRGNISTGLAGNFTVGVPFNIDHVGVGYGTVYQNYSTKISKGGVWKPNCIAKSRLAIIIPFRAREANLWPFLHNIFRFLMLQMLEFRIILVEQAGDALFNRAKLMNIGYKEAQKFDEFDCFIFHDVDQIPEDLLNTYACTEHPRLMVVTRSITDYEIRYTRYFGGGIMMRKEHIEMINGFPNRYYGWGGEDDEIFSRLKIRKMMIARAPNEIGSYTSLDHPGPDMTNPRINRKSVDILAHANHFIDKDGLSNLDYKIILIEERPLFTSIIAHFDGPKSVEETEPIFNPLFFVPQDVVVDNETSLTSD